MQQLRSVLLTGLVTVVLYADDVYAIAHTTRELRNVLDLLSRWASRWGVSFNARKSSPITWYLASCSPVAAAGVDPDGPSQAVSKKANASIK